MTDKIYTGVGSRNTPFLVLQAMQLIGEYLYNQGWVLRSGGAVGADTAFQGIHIRPNDQIYLPWKGFNNSTSLRYSISTETSKYLSMVLDTSHISKLSRAGYLLHSRNVHQVLGDDLKTPSNFLVCWTNGGKDIGGTATAIKLARLFNIPIINLGNLQSSVTKDFVLYFLLKFRGLTNELF